MTHANVTAASWPEAGQRRAALRAEGGLAGGAGGPDTGVGSACAAGVGGRAGGPDSMVGTAQSDALAIAGGGPEACAAFLWPCGRAACSSMGDRLGENGAICRSMVRPNA